MKDNQLELEIEAKPENLSVIADFIATAMRQLGTEQDVFEVQTAVDEACTNVMLHAYSGKGGVISISCELQDNDFIITIRDSGRHFDPTSVPLPDLQADLKERSIGGLGMHLMRRLMDDVSYAFDAEKGNKLVMRKTLARTKT